MLVLTLNGAGYYFISDMGERSADRQVELSSAAMQREIDSALEIQENFGDILEHGSLGQDVVQGNTEAVRSLAKAMVAGPVIDFVTICDKNGVVVARGHSDEAGDQLGVFPALNLARWLSLPWPQAFRSNITEKSWAWPLSVLIYLPASLSTS